MTSRIPVFAAVILQNARYLLCQRPANKRHGGLWEFPGGKMEPGESYLDAARREMSEELGVGVLDVGTPLYSVADPGSPFVIEFVPTTIEGTPVCLEHSDLRWVPSTELSSFDLAPSDRRFVEFLASMPEATTT